MKPQTLNPDSLIEKGLSYKNTGLTLIWHSMRRICTVCIPHVANSTVGAEAISSAVTKFPDNREKKNKKNNNQPFQGQSQWVRPEFSFTEQITSCCHPAQYPQRWPGRLLHTRFPHKVQVCLSVEIRHSSSLVHFSLDQTAIPDQ